MGTGFGGYLAMMGITGEPDIFRCAVDIGGVADWEQQIGEKKWNQYMDPEAGRLQHKLGDPAKEREKFEAISPARRVARIHGAVFVAHARDDGAVEVTQSRHLISELERNHVPVESFIVGEEGQGFGHLDKQVELYQRIEKFLAAHLGG
jgi:dipeptidyl aminopeptidase/acylaminoacyl peptidase